MKNLKTDNLQEKEERQKNYEEKRLEAFRQFMSAHFEEIHCGEYSNELLMERVAN